MRGHGHVRNLLVSSNVAGEWGVVCGSLPSRYWLAIGGLRRLGSNSVLVVWWRAENSPKQPGPMRPVTSCSEGIRFGATSPSPAQDLAERELVAESCPFRTGRLRGRV